MTVTRTLGAALVVAALAPIDAVPVAAQGAYCRPWCVHYSGGGRGGGTNCGFSTYEQCMWTAQGADICMPNGFCPPGSAAGGSPGGYEGWQGDRRRR
jgi:hypothetical protein